MPCVHATIVIQPTLQRVLHSLPKVKHSEIWLGNVYDYRKEADLTVNSFPEINSHTVCNIVGFR
jgi:hypothetical protein